MTIVTGNAEDGRYQYIGTIAQVGSGPEVDAETFSKYAVEHAREGIGYELMRRLRPISIDVNKETGKFKIDFTMPMYRFESPSSVHYRQEPFTLEINEEIGTFRIEFELPSEGVIE